MKELDSQMNPNREGATEPNKSGNLTSNGTRSAQLSLAEAEKLEDKVISKNSTNSTDSYEKVF